MKISSSMHDYVDLRSGSEMCCRMGVSEVGFDQCEMDRRVLVKANFCLLSILNETSETIHFHGNNSTILHYTALIFFSRESHLIGPYFLDR